MRNTARGASGYGKSDASLEISQLLGGGGERCSPRESETTIHFPSGREREGGGEEGARERSRWNRKNGPFDAGGGPRGGHERSRLPASSLPSASISRPDATLLAPIIHPRDPFSPSPPPVPLRSRVIARCAEATPNREGFGRPRWLVRHCAVIADGPPPPLPAEAGTVRVVSWHAWPRRRG